MSRYRKIEVSTWGDARFRKLSPIPPCGQGLWLYLLTGPHTSVIPGLFRSGRLALGESLHWSPEAFSDALAEVMFQGLMEADWDALVVWIPNAVKHNPPASPNVVRSWRTELDLIPECPLKDKAIESIKSFLSNMGDGFLLAFDPSVKPKPKPKPKSSSKTKPNQEQEQEQEQDKQHATVFVVPDWIDKEAWAGYVEMRKRTRKHMTEHARDLIIEDLRQFCAKGIDITAVLNESTKRNWTGVFAPKTPPISSEAPKARQWAPVTEMAPRGAQ